MSILGKLAAVKQAKGFGYNTATATNLTPMSPELVRWFGNVSSSGKSVTEDSILCVSAAWCCLRILCETIGSLPWAIFKDDGKGNSEKVEHPLSNVLIASPNREMDSVEFRETEVLNLAGNGNAYSLIERLGGRINSLTPMRSSLVKPMQKEDQNTRLEIPEGATFFRFSDRGKIEDLPREKVWHVKTFGWNGREGLSPIASAREYIGGAMAAEEFGNRFFSQGGAPSGTLTVPQWLTADQRKIARENMNQLMGGLGNAHRMALFEGGLKPEPWGDMNFEDMQFLMLRQFSVIEICRLYRIPPHMVADLSRATFSNIEHLSQEFVMFTLMPYLTRFEQSAQKWLFKPEERGKFFLRFNAEGLLRADSAGRAAFYTTALQNGWMSRNEVRGKENLNRVEGLDEYTVQLNMAVIDALGKILGAQPQIVDPPQLRAVA